MNTKWYESPIVLILMGIIVGGIIIWFVRRPPAPKLTTHQETSINVTEKRIELVLKDTTQIIPSYIHQERTTRLPDTADVTDIADVADVPILRPDIKIFADSTIGTTTSDSFKVGNKKAVVKIDYKITHQTIDSGKVVTGIWDKVITVSAPIIDTETSNDTTKTK